MRALPGAAGSLMAALCLTACEANTAPNDAEAGGGRTQAPAIAATPAQLLFRIYAFAPERDPPAQILQVSDGGTLDWKADTHTGWITLWHSGAPGRLVVGLNRSHMGLEALDRPPVLKTTITLSAAGASNSPVQIPVVVLISYVPPDKLGPRGNPDPRAQ